MLGQLRRRLFGISPAETSIARRGFTVTNPNVQERLELIGQTFAEGYHAALLHLEAQSLAAALEQIEPEQCGFAYEGAGMGLALVDTITPWPTRYLLDFLHGPGQPHAYMIQIGVGWAVARLKRPATGWLARLDPVANWLLMDGFGFHETYFDWPTVLNKQAVPKRLTGYARRGFDQGVGRALWFVQGASVDRIVATIDAFPAARHNDIWAGVGLASAYAGGVTDNIIEDLTDAAGAENRAALAQGVVFATKTRYRAGNPADQTDMACRICCGFSPIDAVKLFDTAGQNLPTGGALPAFEVWRQRIQQHLQHRHPAPEQHCQPEEVPA